MPEGATAPQAADKIHTDFVKGFIRTQTIVFEDFITYKESKARKKQARCVRKAKITSLKMAM
ncbi:DUF933 domain-containing protein [Enterobacter hormaechei]|uniref:DUF933 domain-containing protein n=1 Tax=Enterobacter hormaechei TaxID=158836 RepID=UPI0034DD8E38